MRHFRLAAACRFTIRSLLVLVAVVSALLAWLTQAPRAQMRAAEHLRLQAVSVVYEDEVRPPPSRLRSLIGQTLGRDFAFDVTMAEDHDYCLLCDDDCAVLAAFPRLTQLGISGRCVTDASMRIIGGLRRLEYVGFYKCAVTDDGVNELAQLPNLCSIMLLDTNVRGLTLGRLSACKELELLYVTDSQLAPEAFAQVGTLVGLWHLTLDGTGATDDDVCQLLGLTRLRQLSLDGNPISDRCLDYVARFPNLISFSAERTRVTADGVRRLNRLRPGLDVYVSGQEWRPPGPPDGSGKRKGEERARVK